MKAKKRYIAVKEVVIKGVTFLPRQEITEKETDARMAPLVHHGYVRVAEDAAPETPVSAPVKVDAKVGAK